MRAVGTTNFDHRNSDQAAPLHDVAAERGLNPETDAATMVTSI